MPTEFFASTHFALHRLPATSAKTALIFLSVSGDLRRHRDDSPRSVRDNCLQLAAISANRHTPREAHCALLCAPVHRLYTTHDAARILRVHPFTVAKSIDRGPCAALPA